jgi:hypothetical protein
VSNKKNETKQQIIDEVSKALGIGPFFIGVGSTEPLEFFRDVAKELGIDLSGVSTKPEIGKRIVESRGGVWDSSCDSRSSASGGGSTVTFDGLARIRQSVQGFESQSSSNREEDYLDIRPGIESLLTYRHHGYEPWYALAELVDNAVASFRIARKSNLLVDQDRLTVDVIFDRENRVIVIEDDAAGISRDRLNDALIAGRSPSDKSDLHQFGMGLKTASFWFGSYLSIETFPAESATKISVEVDLVKLIKNGEGVLPVVAASTGERHGTRITLKNLWPERSVPTAKTLTKVRDYLSSIYRKDIKDGWLILNVGGQVLKPLGHEVLIAPRWDNQSSEPERWEKLIEFDVDGKRVSGVVWLLAKGDTANAGLVLTWKGKAIVGAGAGANDANDSYRPKNIYGRSNSFPSQRLMGELDMSAYPVTAKKDGLEWTEEEQERFTELLRAELDAEPLPLIKMAVMFRKSGKPLDSDKDIREAANSLIGALAGIESSEFSDFDFLSIPDEVASTISEIPEFDVNEIVQSDHLENLDSQLYAFSLPISLPGMRSCELRIEWSPSDSRVVWHNREGQDLLVIHVNRASKFLENYSALPQFHLEPTLRLLMALVLAEIEATSEGLKSARRMTNIVNERLSQNLGQPVLMEPNHG